MATLPIVNTFDRRAGVISAVIAMIILLIVILFLTYEQADPLPEDIPIELAAPLDVTEVYDVVADLGGGGGGDPSESPQNNQNQVEQVITSTNPDSQVSSGTGNVTNSSVDNGPSGDETPNMFGSGGNGGNGGGSGPGFGPDSGPGTNGTGGGTSGAGRKVVKDVKFDLDYDQVVDFVFKLTVDANGNVIKADVVMGQTTTTDQVLINKVKYAVLKTVKYSKSANSAVVFKNYPIRLQPN